MTYQKIGRRNERRMLALRARNLTGHQTNRAAARSMRRYAVRLRAWEVEQRALGVVFKDVYDVVDQFPEDPPIGRPSLKRALKAQEAARLKEE